MKKRCLKLVSVLLAFVLVFSQAGIVFAKAKNVVPVILIHGLGGNALYENVGTENETKIPDYGLDIQTLLTNSEVMSEAVKLLTEEQSVNWNALFNALGDYFRSSNINCDKNGNAKPGQGINNYWLAPLSKHKSYWKEGANAEAAIARQLCETQGSKNVYMFNYDWRLDVRETAKSLRKEVVNVKKRTGAKKVALVGCSLGGAVMSAYLDAYKSKKDIARYVFVNPAIHGVAVARMLRFDIKLDKKAVLSYLKHMEKEYDGGSQETLFKVVGALGDEKIKTAVDNLNIVARNKRLLKKLYLKVIKDWIGNIPAYWECISYKDFNKCVKCMSKIGFLDTKSGLYRKIKAYHKVQGRFNKNIKYAKKHGAEVAIIANYGTKGIPVTSKRNNQTDVLIDTVYASGGATVAKYGKTLGRSGKYVSPDGVIDASTCVLPDNTWFMRNVLHIQYHYGTQATKFICRLACGRVKCNLKAVKKKYGYSQFLKGDSNQYLTNV